MLYDDYLREQAVKFRALAEATPDPQLQEEYFDLAEVCEEIANEVEERATGG